VNEEILISFGKDRDQRIIGMFEKTSSLIKRTDDNVIVP
jgi:hypothetical protein